MKFIAALLATIFVDVSFAGDKFWWMKDPSVFGGQTQQQALDKRPQQQQQQQQPQQQSQYETECPAGTKCVQNHFCNENAIMVNFRVSLTRAQKKKRGKLIPCILANEVAVCCSTARPVPALPVVQQQDQSQQSQQQALQPAQSINEPSISNVVPGGSCPNMGQLPPVEACAGKSSTCWSVGQSDVDCPNNALCCFDGCINSCYFDNTNTNPNPPALTTPAPLRRPPATPQAQPRPQQQQLQAAPSQQNNDVRPQNLQNSRPKRPQRRPAVPAKQVNRPFQGPTAEEKPFVMCPSAMLCVPRANCDLKGFITERTLNITPDLEMLSVPLIPCVNFDTNNIDVCCRDPNYVDPWPRGNNKGQQTMPGNNRQQQAKPTFQQQPNRVSSGGYGK